MGDHVLELRTNADVLRKLENSKAPTAAEVREQRISFAFGSLDSESSMTREQVRQIAELA